MDSEDSTDGANRKRAPNSLTNPPSSCQALQINSPVEITVAQCPPFNKHKFESPQDHKFYIIPLTLSFSTSHMFHSRPSYYVTPPNNHHSILSSIFRFWYVPWELRKSRFHNAAITYLIFYFFVKRPINVYTKKIRRF